MKRITQTNIKKLLVALIIYTAVALACNTILTTVASAAPKVTKSTKPAAKPKSSRQIQKAKPAPKSQSNPPRSKIAFVRNHDIWLMNTDGSKQENLTKSKHSVENDPTWSPDGKRLAFTRGKRQGSLVVNNQVFEIEVATKKVQQITSIKNEEIDSPSYTAAGTGILFQSWEQKSLPDKDKDYPVEHYRYKLNIVEIKTKKTKTVKAGNYLYEAGEFARPFMPNHYEVYYGWWTQAFASFEKLNLLKETAVPLYFEDIKATDEKLYYLAFSKNKLAAGLLDIYENPKLFIKDLKKKNSVKVYASSFSVLTPQAFSPHGNDLVVGVSIASNSDKTIKDSICILTPNKNKLIKIADNASEAAWQP